MMRLAFIPLTILLVCAPAQGQNEEPSEELIAAQTVELLIQSATLSAMAEMQRSLVLGMARIYGANGTRILVLGAQWRVLKAQEQEFEQAIDKAQTASEKDTLRTAHKLVEVTVKDYFEELLKIADTPRRR